MSRLIALACRFALLLALGTVAVSAVTAVRYVPWLGAIALAWAAWRRTLARSRVTGNYGTARLASWRDLLRGKLLSNTGLILGRLGFVAPPSRGQALLALCSPLVGSERACQMVYSAFVNRAWRNDGFIRIRDFVHVGTFAPAGGGKSVSALVPNLLSYADNCVVIDKGGELYKLTAEHREKKLGHRVVRLDPAGLFGTEADCFNPFDWIEPRGKDFIGQARDLANMIVMRTGTEHEPHWNDSSENIVAAFAAYISACEGDPAARNLKGMRTQIVSRTNYTAALERMQQIDDFQGILAELAQSMSWHVERELGSVMSTTQRHTHIFGDPQVDASTWRSSFDPRELRTGRRMTIYIIVPPDRMVVWAPLWRLWLGSLLRIVTKGVPTEKNPVLFMVDEAAHIGRMQVLEDAITLLRGSGVRIWLFFQSLDQINKCFGERSSTVLDNLATQQYFAINSYETAEALSKRIGDETIVVRTNGGNSGSSWSTGVKSDGGSRSFGTNDSSSEAGRKLFFPDEILTLHQSVGLVIHKNHPLLLVELIRYYTDRAFRYRRWRGYGTGRSRGLGAQGMALALLALASSAALALSVASLPAALRPRPGAAAPGRFLGGAAVDMAGEEFGDQAVIGWPVELLAKPTQVKPTEFRWRRTTPQQPLSSRVWRRRPTGDNGSFSNTR